MNRTTQSAARRRFILAVRVVAFLIAVALGVVGVWLIVTGRSTKGIRIGALASFWALLLGAFAVLGSRVPPREMAGPAAQQFAAPPPLSPPHRGGLDRRNIGEIERAAVGAARREFQAGLEEMLRREVATAVSREVAGLRSEVTALRNELVEKVGGQIRLERIETTRLIGSDLEALQREVRQLRRANLDADPNLATRTARPLDARVPADPDVHDAEIVLERVHPPVKPAGAAPSDVGMSPATARLPHGDVPPWIKAAGSRAAHGGAAAPDAPPWQPAPSPAPVQQPEVPTPQPPEAPAPQPAAASARDVAADPFAALPRIRPFTEFPLDMIPPSGGDSGRRHRPDNSEDEDVLARILAREQGR